MRHSGYRVRWSAALALVALAGPGCGGPTGGPDAAPEGGRDVVVADGATMDAPADSAGTDAAPDAGPTSCASDTQCDDGTYCNGAERCMPGAAGADARGCVAGTAPCPSGQTCMESAHTCSGGCPDVDGDGHTSSACGGDDCDDADPHRFPGNTEVCAVAPATGGGDGGVPSCDGGAAGPAVMRVDPGHDEDCDPTTYANGATHDGDHDGDGYVDSACENTDSSGTRHGGDDCADIATTGCIAPQFIHPTAPEVCDGVDNNCNGTVDEGVGHTYYPDCDLDGRGADAGSMAARCSAPVTPPPCPTGFSGTWVTVGDDCDDTHATVFRGAPERCDGLDNNCDGVVDGPLAVMDCATSHPTAQHVASWTCSAAGICVDNCNAGFTDCDDTHAVPDPGLDNGCELATSSDPLNCGACGRACGGLTCQASTCVRTISQIDGGGSSMCAVRTSGSVSCWGENGAGQLGDGTTMDRSSPVAVVGLGDATQVSVGAFHACARRATGAVVCWGDNSFGELGNNSTTSSSTPVAVAGLTDAVEVSAGTYFTCARRATGAVVCWGDDTFGELGNGSVTAPSTCVVAGSTSPCGKTPVAVSGISTATQIDAGSHGSVCALLANHQVRCWGRNAGGENGDGSVNVHHYAPVTVMTNSTTALANVQAIAVGFTAACAVVQNTASTPPTNVVECWGLNSNGVLGDGTTTDRPEPTLATAAMRINDAVSVTVSAGAFACVTRTSGVVSCWGDNSNGNLGNNTYAPSYSPSTVYGLMDGTAVTTTQYSACGIRTSGGVVCWGKNDVGQLGDPTFIMPSSPIPRDLLDP